MKDLQLFVNKNLFNTYLNEIEQYYNTVNADINKLQNKLNTKIKKSQKDISTNEQAESYFDELSERYNANDKVVKKFFNYSVVIQIYALIEERLNSICDFLYKRNKQSLTYKDLNGNGSQRALSYLGKVFSIHLEKDEEDFIKKINIIRNVLAHVNGNLSEEPKEMSNKIKQVITKSPGLSIDEYKTLQISDEYISYLFENMRKTFKDIYSKTEKPLISRSKTI